MKHTGPRGMKQTGPRGIRQTGPRGVPNSVFISDSLADRTAGDETDRASRDEADWTAREQANRATGSAEFCGHFHFLLWAVLAVSRRARVPRRTIIIACALICGCRRPDTCAVGARTGYVC